MKQNRVKDTVSTLLISYGAVCALLTMLLAYLPYYTKVLAPIPAKQGFLRPMIFIGSAVFALVLAVAWLIRDKWEFSPKWAGIPTLFLGAVTCLVPLATPAGLNELLVQKTHWLTPTIVGNGLTAAYAVFVLLMLLGGLSAATLLFRHSYTQLRTGAAKYLYPVFFLLCGVTAGAVSVLLPNAIGYDRLFFLAGAICAVCAITGLLLGWQKPALEE